MKYKRMMSLLLSLMLMLSLLAGCSGSQDAPNNDDPQSNSNVGETPSDVPDGDGTQSDSDVSDTSDIEAVPSEAYERIHSILKDSEFYYLDETEALAPYYEKAEQRKEAILNSPTEIVKANEFIPGQTYTGTAYYVSPNGNDANDGLSPETAWQNIYKVNSVDLYDGDAVFF